MTTPTAPGRALIGRDLGFWVAATMYALFLFASSTPSPLYVVYQAEWHFSSITLTTIFAVYVLTLLLALLFAGSLSDHIGRRPVLLTSGAIQLAALVCFAIAPDVFWLGTARVLQGVATGLATGALSAWLLDLAPEERPGRGATVSTLAPSAGLALGALATGLLVQYAPAPTHLVYWLLVGGFVLGTFALAALPETVAAQARWWQALRPRVGVAPAARGAFRAALPCFVAVWALSGFALSLGGSVTAQVLHRPNHVIGGLVVMALFGTAFVATLVTTRLEARTVMLAGCALLVVGVAAAVVAVHVASAALFFIGYVLAGLGFGPAFTGAFRTVVALAPPSGRAALVAAIFVVSYLAFSVPAVIAGIAIIHVGLVSTATWYGAAVMALCVVAVAAMGRRPRVPSAALSGASAR